MQKLNYQNVHHHILQTAIFDEWMRLQWAKLVQNYAIQIKNNVYKKIRTRQELENRTLNYSFSRQDQVYFNWNKSVKSLLDD